MRHKVLGAILGLILVVLTACDPATNPLTGGPEVVAPVGPDEARVVYITQRAPEEMALSDVFLTLKADRTSGPVEIKVGDAYISGTFVSDDRCFEVEGQPLVTCELGDIAPGELAPPVEVTLARGVRLACIASGFVGGEIAGYRPLVCRSATP